MSTPTAEHIDAVARAINLHEFNTFLVADLWDDDTCNRDWYRENARAILTSTDPAVHAALAASLPAEVMLAALVDRGTLGYVVTNADGSKVWLQEVAP